MYSSIHRLIILSFQSYKCFMHFKTYVSYNACILYANAFNRDAHTVLPQAWISGMLMIILPRLWESEFSLQAGPSPTTWLTLLSIDFFGISRHVLRSTRHFACYLWEYRVETDSTNTGDYSSSIKVKPARMASIWTKAAEGISNLQTQRIEQSIHLKHTAKLYYGNTCQRLRMTSTLDSPL